MDGPSLELKHRLEELGLVTSRDWQRARVSVQRFSRDLPVFDSMWIDALLTQGTLTSYQAELVASGKCEQLRLGEWIVMEPLAKRESPKTFLVRSLDNKRAVAKRFSASTQSFEELQDKIRHLRIARDRSTGSEQYWVGPDDVVSGENEFTLISEFVDGPSCAELLTRHGRVPAYVLTAIARQLFCAIRQINELGLHHAQIHLDNLRLNTNGQLRLVDTSVEEIVQQRLHEHRLALKDCEGLAPERIGSHAPVTESSQLYAAGMTLWHLAAGRPPFPHGDPVELLAVQSRQAVPQLSDYVSELPENLSTLIQSCVALEPINRPASIEDATAVIGHPNRKDERVLKQFLNQTTAPTIFAAPPRETSGKNRQRLINASVACTTILFLVGTLYLLADRGPGAEPLLNVPSSPLAVAPEVKTVEAILSNTSSPTNSREPRPLPAPDEKGVILLETEGPYQAATIDTAGELTVRGTDGISPVIALTKASLRLRAPAVRLENVTIRTTGQTTLSTLLLVECQQLTVDRCHFDGNISRRQNAIAWKKLNPLDRSGGRLEISRSFWNHCRAALSLSDAPRSIVWSQSLIRSGDAAMVFHSSASATPIQIGFQQVACRDLSRVLDIVGRKTSIPNIQCSADRSVFAMRSPSSLVGFYNATNSPIETASCLFTGKQALLSVGTRELMGLKNLSDGSTQAVPLQTSVRGFSIGEIEFAGEVEGSLADSQLTRFHGPHRGELRAGVPELLLREADGK
ncbi:serine/threonine protein kinase [Calycomorphotria hydatis]|uniref:Serine/threonine-protein kinase PrkC n=1 Tax=Calycomorphotria hydatis TaxID=2528027 RepID=A0A517T9H0_9PLAN|nr:protein kinase [Calycomorphotria hydatis]QDT65022.1 Serine/threonine-protein kinase PrkC [Calycomorphotria hydatis]